MLVRLAWVGRCQTETGLLGSDISSDGGLLPYRELDHALGLTELGGEVLSETRRGQNTRHLLVGLLRQSVFGRLAGLLAP